MDEACLGNKLGYSKNSSSLYLLCIYIYIYIFEGYFSISRCF